MTKRIGIAILLIAAMAVLIVCGAMAQVFTGSGGSGNSQNLQARHSSTLTLNQTDRLKDQKILDVLIFPSRVEFGNPSVSWGDPCAETQTVNILVSPVVMTDAPEDASVSALFADVTTNSGDTWHYVRFDEDPETGEWYAEVALKDWQLPDESFATGTAGAAAATYTEPMGNCAVEFVPAGGGEKVVEEQPTVDVSFWAMDSLGNITAQLYQQIRPKSEQDVRFAPLIIDPADPDRVGPQVDYAHSPDRDILNTSGAWLRNQLLLRMKIAGTTNPFSTVPPALNYYSVRFISINETSFKTQLGAGMYHYHKLKRKHADVFDKGGNESFPFTLEYDPLNLYQLGAIIETAREMEDFPPVLEYYMELLEDEGLEDALTGDLPAPLKKTVFDTGIQSSHLGDRIYWGINLKAFTNEESDEKDLTLEEVMAPDKWDFEEAPVSPPDGIVVRFYTGYKNSEESGTIIRDDMTAYSTILFSHYTFTRGENIQFEGLQSKPAKNDESEPTNNKAWQLIRQDAQIDGSTGGGPAGGFEPSSKLAGEDLESEEESPEGEE